MVFILDDGAYFNAPLDKIWKLLEAHGADGLRFTPMIRTHPLSLLHRIFRVVTAISVERADLDVSTAGMSRIGAVIHSNYYLH